MPAPSQRLSGSIKWFNSDKGYGFIVKDGGGTDVFCHITALPEGVKPSDGDKVTFEIVTGRDGKTKASDVRFT